VLLCLSPVVSVSVSVSVSVFVSVSVSLSVSVSAVLTVIANNLNTLNLKHPKP
jgi:hypothetical protein